MALRAVPDHPKFAHLKSLIGRPKCATLGCLECIWHFTGRFTPQGNIGKYTDAAIEGWCEWDGEPGKLVRALSESGWIDVDDAHRLLIHDWKDHADKATKNALKRGKLDFCTPTVRTESRKPLEFERGVRTVEPNSGSPSRLPEPVPVPVPESVPVPGQRHISSPQTTRRRHASQFRSEQQADSFAEFWEVYWRKVGKVAAEKSYAKLITSTGLHAQVMAAIMAQSSTMRQRDPEKRPHAATWLNGQRWNDEIAAEASGKSDFDRLMEAV